MTDDAERQKIAQWILERNLQWITAADAKTGVIVAVNTGMLGALAATFGGASAAQRTDLAMVFTVLAAFILGVGICFAAAALFPRTAGPGSRYIFFGGIAAQNLSDFSVALRTATASQLLEDCLSQIHRNAQIANAKFAAVRSGMAWSFVGLIPWALALAWLKK